MKKHSLAFLTALIFFALAVTIICTSCTGKGNVTINPQSFAPADVIETVKRHTCSIAVYYYIGEQEYQKRLREQNAPVVWNNFGPIQIPIVYRPSLMFPTVQQDQDGQPKYAIAYIGSGTLLKRGYIISVRHLFVHDDPAYTGQAIYVFFDGVDEAIEADIVAISEGKEFSDDYAVIKLRRELALPGIKIAKNPDVQSGDKIIASGTPGGLRITRYTNVTRVKWFFYRGEDNRLHFGKWNAFYYLCICGGGPGDSGGSIINTEGEYIATLYCGVSVYGQYVFANPNVMLWTFLEKKNLSWIAR